MDSFGNEPEFNAPFAGSGPQGQPLPSSLGGPDAEVWESLQGALRSLFPDTIYRTFVEPLVLRSIVVTEEGSALIDLEAQSEITARMLSKQHLGKITNAFSRVLQKPAKVKLSVLGDGGAPSPSPSLKATAKSESPKPIKNSDLSSNPGTSPQGFLGFSHPAAEPPPSSSEAETRDHFSLEISDNQLNVSPMSLNPLPTIEAAPSRATVMHIGLSRSSPLNPKYTFDSFVVGASNQFAHASALAVADAPAKRYNPLLIYGPSGVGKTHLLHAIGNRMIQKNPSIRVGYFTTETFVNELIESFRPGGDPALFRSKYRDSFDVLLIDDIAFLARKEKSEEEFFHTFNALHETRRQIVMTCDRPPKELERLNQRMITRFLWGLTADVTLPEIETRIAILKTKAEQDDIYLPDEVANYIATHIKENVRELESILVKLHAHASFAGTEISLEMAKQELKGLMAHDTPQVTAESIQLAVTKHFEIKMSDLKGSSRKKEFVVPRQIAITLIRKYTSLPFEVIGQHFGGRNHATVMHACETIETKSENDLCLRKHIESIQNML